MKIQNLLIILFLATTVIFAYLYFSLRDRNYSNLSEVGVAKIFSEADCQKSLPKNEGSTILLRDAYNKIRDFVSTYRQDHDDSVYGYVIGLDHIDTLRSQIAFYNLNNPNDTITGIHFYQSLRTKGIGKGRNVKIKDLVMIPVDYQGRDVEPVHNGTDPSRRFNIYSNFRPCPRICGSKVNPTLHSLLK